MSCTRQILEEHEPSAILSGVPNIYDATRRPQPQEDDAAYRANHENELQRVGPNDGLQSAYGGVEDTDDARDERDNVQVDARNLRKSKRWHIKYNRHEDDDGDGVNGACCPPNALIKSQFKVLKR